MRPLQRPHRNQLVWVDERGWRELRAADWDAEARSLLAHWSAQRLPLVVARDRVGTAPGQLCVGLPAPLRWSRRRLALAVAWDHVQRTGTFPTLVRAARAMRSEIAAIGLASRLSACGAVARVYGGYGWQALSGEAYVHAGSDLDLLIEVDDIDAACASLPLLQQARPGCRIDGEFLFPDGDALAWRELASALSGSAERVLVKSRGGARLVGFEAWRASMRQATA
jgi:phosphoribosyl-dephospho-CoA transferase